MHAKDKDAVDAYMLDDEVEIRRLSLFSPSYNTLHILDGKDIMSSHLANTQSSSPRLRIKKHNSQ
jgi:hypothetical protein